MPASVSGRQDHSSARVSLGTCLPVPPPPAPAWAGSLHGSPAAGPGPSAGPEDVRDRGVSAGTWPSLGAGESLGDQQQLPCVEPRGHRRRGDLGLSCDSDRWPRRQWSALEVQQLWGEERSAPWPARPCLSQAIPARAGWSWTPTWPPPPPPPPPLAAHLPAEAAPSPAGPRPHGPGPLPGPAGHCGRPLLP